VDITSQERSPPPRPLAPEFPTYIPRLRNRPLTKRTSDKLGQEIFRLKTPADVAASDIERLNVHMTQNYPIEKLIRGGEEYQNRPFQYDESLTAAINEIQVSNDVAFSSVLRLPQKDGEKRPRLAVSYPFFVALEQMSHYWDDSKDNYYEVPDTSATIPGTDIRPSPGQDIKMEDDAEESAKNETSTVRMKEVYKGRRTGNGLQMPVECLEKVAKSFIDICRVPFGIAAYERRFPARLIVRGFKMPIVLRYDVGAVPKDRALARLERLEGPVMGVHARPDLKFKSDNIKEGCPSQVEILDFYREIGALLLVAQKRARMGETEVLPGIGKWWGQKARWGGGEGGHMPYESDEEPTQDLSKKKEEKPAKAEDDLSTSSDDDQPPLPSEPKEKPRTLTERPSASSVTPQKRSKSKPRAKVKGTKPPMPSYRVKTMMQKYKKVTPGEPLWDDHIRYLQIGRQDAFDDVFLVSALNCHISFLHMKVHKNYLRWLEFGAEAPAQKWVEDLELRKRQLRENTLYVERSRWYNMFEVEDRMEALVGLWRIMGWIFRANKNDGSMVGHIGEGEDTTRVLDDTGMVMHQDDMTEDDDDLNMSLDD
jgi:hypothetical protein